jgi:2-polyprenyl-6-methoxyphenol hydroxylase-like FAD-dependent oxidoreductase
MSRAQQNQAVVIGAGMSGLASAAALAAHFDHVTILERDSLPAIASSRPGTPQSLHPHGLLAGGQQALCELFPGFDQDLAAAGAVHIQGGLEVREELPGFDPFPQRDLGLDGYTMSRPLIEFTARRRTLQIPNVEIRDQCRVLAVVAADDGSVAGVRCQAGNGVEMTIAADLVVDASGRGTSSLAFLKDTGRSQPDETSIGIDLTYVTAVFAAPTGKRDWKLVITFPDAPASTKSGYLMPIEGDRWMVLVSERHGELPPTDFDEFLEMAKGLRTPTIYDAIKDLRPIERLHRFGFPESSWRHYERLGDLPTGLLPVGDAISRFNPIYGQGMAVAAKEAVILRDLLGERSGGPNSLVGLGQAFMDRAQQLIAAAWSQSVLPDFVHPKTRGERPADLENRLRFSGGLMRLAAADADVHKLFVGVRHLIESPAALRDPELVRRVEAEMAQA